MKATSTIIIDLQLDNVEDEGQFVAWWERLIDLCRTRFRLVDARLMVLERARFVGIFDFPLPGIWALAQDDHRWAEIERGRPPSKIAVVEGRWLTGTGKLRMLTTSELDAWLRERDLGRRDFVLIDTLGPEHFAERRIRGSVNLPARDVDGKTARKVIGPDLDRAVVVYCSDYGCGASTLAAERLAKVGYDNLHEYPGGIAEWSRWRPSAVEGP